MAKSVLGQWRWDAQARELHGRAGVVRLTRLETDLLEYLLVRAGRVVETQALLRDVWHYAPKVQSRAVAHTVARLRRKLGTDGDRIVTEYGLGYRLEVPDEGEVIGRRHVLALVRAALSQHQWVCLYGIGGVGKTTLARTIALEGDVVWVDVGHRTTQSELVAAVGHALGVDRSGVSIPTVRKALADRDGCRLVLDGAEHLSEDVAQALQDWRRVKGLDVVVTSRRLRFDMPAVLVEPLDVDAAVRLFTMRADSVQPAEVLPDALVRTVVEAVDGLPLAVELAAARLRILQLPDLVTRLQRDLAILGGGERSLHAVLEGSWALLSPSDQATLAAAALFPGPFQLDDLMPVVGLPEVVLLDAVDTLTKSALVVEVRPDFRLLDVVRTTMAERASDDAIQRFVARAVARAADAYQLVYEEPYGIAERLRREAPQFAAAFAHTEEVAARVQLAITIRSHDVMFGHAPRHSELLGSVDVSLLPDALALDVLSARNTGLAGGDRDAWLASCEAALARARVLADPGRVIDAWTRWVHVVAAVRSREEAATEGEDLLAFASEHAAPDHVVGLVHLMLGEKVATTSAAAVGHLREAVRALEIRPDLQARAMCGLSRARCAMCQPKAAQEHAEAALVLAERVQNLRAALSARLWIARSLAEQGRYRDAVAMARDALDEARRYGSVAVELRLALVVLDAELDDHVALEGLEALVRRAEAVADMIIVVQAHMAAAFRQHRLGRTAEALRGYSRGADRAGPHMGGLASIALLWRQLAEMELGQRDTLSPSGHSDEQAVMAWRVAAGLTQPGDLEEPKGTLPWLVRRTAELARRVPS